METMTPTPSFAGRLDRLHRKLNGAHAARLLRSAKQDHHRADHSPPPPHQLHGDEMIMIRPPSIRASDATCPRQPRPKITRTARSARTGAEYVKGCPSAPGSLIAFLALRSAEHP